MPEIIIENDGGDYRDSYDRHRHGHHHHHHRRRRYRYCCPCLGVRWPRMHSTHRFHVAAALSLFVLLCAFVLFLLPAISLPLIKPIYLLDIASASPPSGQPETSIATDLRFGVWGFCASTEFNPPTLLGNTGDCTKPALGYTIPADVASVLELPTAVTNAIEETLTIILVLHPVVAGLALAALLLALGVRSKAATILALILSVFTAIVGSAVLAIDIALVLVARDEVHKELGDILTVSFGNAVWMIVVAVALEWLGVILLSAIACRCCGIRRKHGWYGDGYYG
jgi:hypothetical protein